ncbi:(2Fe-2S) ferredoxin domain-containing protein [Cohnella cholangitidis]|uniref:(2Fe-2S) ferredoxin domain-containing protein n=1 Tax=Cohnella cholangitidis TaxID=2598458 RepID=A0A7G5C6A8_9BACL|nr:(2Fe-2S) ferredoxin domain-containing protein [Cohnella cholangitidis]QMV44742.1 (2Fe-2S) ferredoxin domain-containing protein [Cohnella cholangitidis]
MSTWDLQGLQTHLLICNGESCMLRQGEEVTIAIREEIARLGADRFIHTTRTRCNGRCVDACVVIAYPEGSWYKDMTPESGKELIQNLIEGKKLESRLIYSFGPYATPTGTSVKGNAK